MSFSSFTPTEAGKIFKTVVGGAKLKSGAYKTFLSSFSEAETKEVLKYIFKYQVNQFAFEDLDELIKNIEYLKDAKKNTQKEKIQKQIEELQKELEGLK
jgi:hypothetical protein